MIINREVLNTSSTIGKTVENFDMFSYTLEVASVMNDEISQFTEGVIFGSDKPAAKFNFENIVSAILEALFNALKKLFRHFIAFLAQLASMGSSFEIELRRFENKLRAFDGNVEISNSIPYYEYTNISMDYPGVSVYKYIDEMVTRYIYEYNNCMSKGNSSVFLVQELDKKIDTNKEVNMLRNRLIGNRTDERDCSDFARILHEFFRNNSSSPTYGTTIPGKRIYNDFYLPYVNSKNEIKQIKKEESKCNSEIKKIKNNIKNHSFDLSAAEKFSDDVANELVARVNSIQKKLCTIVDLASQDILLMYGQKLQAYKEFKLMARQILVASIKACIVQGG
jgi:hypothetical protein